MTLQVFVKLCARAWALKALVLIAEGVPARVSPLAAAAGASRAAMASSLERCRELDLLASNPGHGHPLRPAVVLTPAGQLAAAAGSDVLQLVPDADAQKVLRRSWTLPILAVLDDSVSFSDLRRRLTPITDRALSMALKDLQSRGWISRTVTGHSTPPKTVYHCTGTGIALREALTLRLQATERLSA